MNTATTDDSYVELADTLSDDQRSLPVPALNRLVQLREFNEAREGRRLQLQAKRATAREDLNEERENVTRHERQVSRGEIRGAHAEAESAKRNAAYAKAEAKLVALDKQIAALDKATDNHFPAAMNAVQAAFKAGHILADAGTVVAAKTPAEAEAELLTISDQFAALHVERKETQSAPIPLEDQERRIRADVETRASEKLPDYRRLMSGNGGVLWPGTFDQHGVRKIEGDALVFWLFGEQIVEKAMSDLRGKIDPDACMTNAERDAAVAKVDAEIEALDRYACRLSEKIGGPLRVRSVARGELPVSGLAILDLVIVGTAAPRPKPAPNKPLQHMDGPADPAARVVN